MENKRKFRNVKNSLLEKFGESSGDDFRLKSLKLDGVDEPLKVDMTPPTVENLRAEIDGTGRSLKATFKDSTSKLVEYAVSTTDSFCVCKNISEYFLQSFFF